MNRRHASSRLDLPGDESEVDPPDFSCTFRTAVHVSFMMHRHCVRPNQLSSVLSEISENLVPGFGAAARPFPAIVRLTTPIRRNRELETTRIFPCPNVHLSTCPRAHQQTIGPFTALRQDSDPLMARLLAASLVHTASPETVTHRLETWDNNLAKQGKRDAGMADSISTGRAPVLADSRGAHLVLASIMVFTRNEVACVIPRLLQHFQPSGRMPCICIDCVFLDSGQ